MNKSIYDKQAEPLQIQCLFAQRAKYNQAKIIAAVYFTICVVCAVVFSVLKTLVPSDLITGLSIGLSLATVFAGDTVNAWEQKMKKEAATIQNCFDMTLYSTEDTKEFWKKPVSEYELLEKVSKYPKQGFCENDRWYEDYSKKPHHMQVIYCQSENVRWDYNLRKNYGAFCNILLGITIGAIVISTIILNLRVLDMIGMLAWCLPFIKYWRSFRKNMKADDQRIRRIQESIHSYLNMKEALDEEGWLKRAVDLQERLFEHRQKTTLVPNFFYKLMWKKQQQDEESMAQNINNEQ